MKANLSEPEGRQRVQTLIHKIIEEAPTLFDLDPGQLEVLARAVVWGNLRDELKRRSDLARIPYTEEKEVFLQQAGRSGSEATRSAYRRSLDKAEAWCRTQGIQVLEMGPREADDFLYGLRTDGRAPASVRLDAAGVSSFFSFLERRYRAVTNPFRGSRARPAAVPVRELAVPGPDDWKVLTDSADPALKAALVCLGARGFRVGALPTLILRHGKFRGRSKGRVIMGRLPVEVLEALGAAGLDPRQPFQTVSAKQLGHRVRHHCRKLHAQGRIGAVYSAHDLRHYFAVQDYAAHRDIHRLKGLLGHHSVETTERYLRSVQVL